MRKDSDTSKAMLGGSAKTSKDARIASFLVSQLADMTKDIDEVIDKTIGLNNETLKTKYDEMHSVGQSAWFDDGELERNLIFDMGMPWANKSVLEIGCGEGNLCSKISAYRGDVIGIDYSKEAIDKAKSKYHHLSDSFFNCDYVKYWKTNIDGNEFDTIAMQGVLEHLNNPFKELD